MHPAEETNRPRRTLTLAAIAVVVVALGAVAYVATKPRGVEAVRRVLADEGAFDTTTKASEGFARVSDMLRAEGERCAQADSAAPEQCASLSAAAAWAQVFAFRARGCTQRAISEARFDLHKHLGGLGKSSLPRLPDC